MSEWLVLAGTLTAAASGFPGLLFPRSSLFGQRLTTLLAVLGSGLGLAGVGWFWATGESQPIVIPWALPGGVLNVAIDGLSRSFSFPSS
jgi:hypothetical protein